MKNAEIYIRKKDEQVQNVLTNISPPRWLFKSQIGPKDAVCEILSMLIRFSPVHFLTPTHHMQD